MHQILPLYDLDRENIISNVCYNVFDSLEFSVALYAGMFTKNLVCYTCNIKKAIALHRYYHKLKKAEIHKYFCQQST